MTRHWQRADRRGLGLSAGSGLLALFLLIAGVMAVYAEPPIEPAIVAFAAAGAAGVVGAVSARGKWSLVVVNALGATCAGLALVVLWSLMTH